MHVRDKNDDSPRVALVERRMRLRLFSLHKLPELPLKGSLGSFRFHNVSPSWLVCVWLWYRPVDHEAVYLRRR